MLRLAICCGIAVGVSAAGTLADENAKAPGTDTPAANVQTSSITHAAPKESPEAPASANADTAAKAANQSEPARDSTLIEVPSNTLGPGLPLWLRREHEASEARIARAQADYAEALAAAAAYQAQQAADEGSYYGPYDPYGGVVVYGPHLPGLRGALRARPVPHVSRAVEGDRADRGVPTDNDPFDAAQRGFYENSRPRIGPTIEAQLDAQRRFGRNATPPIADIQRGIDNAVINARRGAPLPGAANDQKVAPRPRPKPRQKP